MILGSLGFPQGESLTPARRCVHFPTGSAVQRGGWSEGIDEHRVAPGRSSLRRRRSRMALRCGCRGRHHLSAGRRVRRRTHRQLRHARGERGDGRRSAVRDQLESRPVGLRSRSARALLQPFGRVHGRLDHVERRGEHALRARGGPLGGRRRRKLVRVRRQLRRRRRGARQRCAPERELRAARGRRSHPRGSVGPVVHEAGPRVVLRRARAEHVPHPVGLRNTRGAGGGGRHGAPRRARRASLRPR
jgi:hypothetical protein